MRKIIPYGQHYVDTIDIKSVTRAITSKSLTQGSRVLQFENPNMQ